MNKIIIPAVALSVAVGIGSYLFGTFNSANAYAYNGRNNTNMGMGFQDKATILGISTEELNNLRASGKTMLQIAEDKGISVDTFHQKVEDAAIARWRTRGFTEQEIQDRLAVMEDRQENCDGTQHSGGMMGSGGGRGFNRN